MSIRYETATIGAMPGRRADQPPGGGGHAPPRPIEATRAPTSRRTCPLLAIDIGAHGALALLDGDGHLLDVVDMPILEDGPASRPTVNAALLAALVRRWAPSTAVCEFVAARPGEAASGAFAFGRSRGVIEGVIAAQGIPLAFRTPAWWKRRVGIPAGREHKDTARSIAIARWPDRADLFARKLDHDRAEAALIGVAHLGDGAKA